MAFQNQPGCGCCGCSSGSMTATATGCGNGINNPTWTVKLAGVTVASATGPITASGLAPGTYDLDIDVTGYNHYHTTFTIDSSCNAVPLGNLSLTLASGYVCCSGMARQDTYYFTDGNGTHALVWNGAAWAACATHPNYSTTTWSLDPNNNSCTVCTPITIDVPYCIQLICINSKVRFVWMSNPTCDSLSTTETNGICNSTNPISEGMGSDGANCSAFYGTQATSSLNSYNFDSASVQTINFGTPQPPPGIIPGPYTMSR